MVPPQSYSLCPMTALVEERRTHMLSIRSRPPPVVAAVVPTKLLHKNLFVVSLPEGLHQAHQSSWASPKSIQRDKNNVNEKSAQTPTACPTKRLSPLFLCGVGSGAALGLGVGWPCKAPPKRLMKI